MQPVAVALAEMFDQPLRLGRCDVADGMDAERREFRVAFGPMPLTFFAASGQMRVARPSAPSSVRADPTTLRSPEVRRAGREMPSLALMDSRNLTLRWAAAVEAHGDAALDATPLEGEPSMRWALGHTAWFREHWIRRNGERR